MKVEYESDEEIKHAEATNQEVYGFEDTSRLGSSVDEQQEESQDIPEESDK